MHRRGRAGQNRGEFRGLLGGAPFGLGLPPDGDRRGDVTALADGPAAAWLGARLSGFCSAVVAGQVFLRVGDDLPAMPAVCGGSPGGLGDGQVSGLFFASTPSFLRICVPVL